MRSIADETLTTGGPAGASRGFVNTVSGNVHRKVLDSFYERNVRVSLDSFGSAEKSYAGADSEYMVSGLRRAGVGGPHTLVQRGSLRFQ